MKRHSLDVVSLVFGLIFVAIAGSWIVRRNWSVGLPGAGWYVAAALIVAGLFGIISTLRRGDSDAPPAAVAPPTTATGSPAGFSGSPASVTPDDTAGDTADYGVITEDKPEDRGF
jgi:hypothetical protein